MMCGNEIPFFKRSTNPIFLLNSVDCVGCREKDTITKSLHTICDIAIAFNVGKVTVFEYCLIHNELSTVLLL